MKSLQGYVGLAVFLVIAALVGGVFAHALINLAVWSWNLIG